VVNQGPFTPFNYRPEGAPLRSTVLFPGGVGGANWGGTSYDPASGLLFVSTQDVGALGSIERAREGAPLPYDKTTPGRSTFDARIGEQNWPCQKPPWGRLTAVNTATGDIAWQVPLGVTDGLPAAKQLTGRPLLAGAISTASGLLFIAATDDNRIRALETKTGKELWVAKLEKRGNANPMTYATRPGRQFVAIVASDTLVAYALR
jgi:quinoprotein glucose dehydrogenase